MAHLSCFADWCSGPEGVVEVEGKVAGRVEHGGGFMVPACHRDHLADFCLPQYIIWAWMHPSSWRSVWTLA